MNFSIFAFLLIAGIGAGLTSTLAGLASLVSYPALLAIGVPPVIANVTNTAALVFTGVGSAVSSLDVYKRQAHSPNNTKAISGSVQN